MPKDLLDLHGHRVEEVWPKLDRFLRDAEAAGLEQVRIMTGKGTGKVREETLKALKMGGFPYKPEKLKNGSTNDGVWVVYL
ncbi:MAG: Smr/MutS family protein [Bdellovibrionales bacterium]|nr:Smr/MutS family protein [Bdellovibrionales bacterium]